MSTEFQEVLCDEHGIGGDGEYFDDGNDAQLGRINVFYYEGGKYAPRAVFFDLEPGVIDAVRASPLGEHFRPGTTCTIRADKNGPKTTTEGLTPILLTTTPILVYTPHLQRK
jgi:hypothetical protein